MANYFELFIGDGSQFLTILLALFCWICIAGIGRLFFPNNTELSFKQYNYDDLIKKLNLLQDQNLCFSEGKKNQDYIVNFLNEGTLLSKYKF